MGRLNERDRERGREGDQERDRAKGKEGSDGRKNKIGDRETEAEFKCLCRVQGGCLGG